MSNLNKGQVSVIRGILSFLNTHRNELGIPSIKFDELSTSKDSMCLATTEGSTPVETVADVTGTAFRGKVELNLIYRVMLSRDGTKDLDYIGVVDSILDYLKKNYKSIEDEFFFIDNLTEKSRCTLETVYSGGVKDFKGIFVVNYERSAN
jgi:hypothetical protein